MRVLFLPHEQYQPFEYEAGNFEVRLPALNCGLITEHRDFVYQRVLRTRGREAMNREAWEAARAFRPDVVVYFATWPAEDLDAEVLFRISCEIAPVISVVFDTDKQVTPHEMKWFGACDCLATLTSIHDYLRFRELSRLCGDHPSAAALIGHNVLTEYFCPAETPKRHDVAFIGSLYGSRHQFIADLEQRLTPAGVKMFVGGGNFNDQAKRSFGFYGTAWLSPQAYLETIRSARIFLNLQAVASKVTQLKGRVFEILSCGTLCLTDANQGGRLLLPADGVVFYDGFEDCLEKIRWLLADPDSRERIARRGYEWYRETYDYHRHWQGLLQAAVERGPPPAPPVFERAYQDYRATAAAHDHELGRYTLARLEIEL
jgi:hypothetical protein